MTDSKKLTITWIELALVLTLVFSGVAIFLFIGKWVELQQAVNEPLEITYQIRNNLPLKQANLNRAQAEVSATQAKLIAENLDQVSRRHQLDALVKAPETKSGEGEIDSAAKATVEKLRSEIKVHENIIKTLSDYLVYQTNTGINAQVDLDRAKRLASTDFAKAKVSFQTHNKLATLVYSLIVIGLWLFLIWVAISFSGLKTKFKTNRSLVFYIALAMLSVVIGYEAVGFLGATLVAVVITLLVLMFVPARQTP